MQKQYRIPLFYLVTFLFWASVYTYVPLLTSYVVSLGASNQMAGLIVGSYGFVQMILRIPVGAMSDRFNKRRLFISIGLSFSIFSTLGLLMSKDISIILIFRGMAGITAATWVDFTILFSSYFKKEQASSAMGTLAFYNTIGQTAAMFFGPIAADIWDIRAPFIIGIALATAGLGLSFFLVENPETKKSALTVKSVVHAASNKTLLKVSFLAILSQVVTFSTVNGFTPQYAQEYLNISKSAMGILTVCSSLPGAFASLFAGKYLLHRFSEKKLVVTGFLMTSVFTLIIPFAGSLPVLLFTQVIAGFGRGLSFPMLMGLSIKDVPPEKRATSMGFFQSIYGLGMFAGPIVMGFIGDIAGLRSGFFCVGFIALLTALLSVVMIREEVTE